MDTFCLVCVKTKVRECMISEIDCLFVCEASVHNGIYTSCFYVCEGSVHNAKKEGRQAKSSICGGYLKCW